MLIPKCLVVLGLFGCGLTLACGGSGGPDVATEEATGELRSSKKFDCGDSLKCDRSKEYCLETHGPGARPREGEEVHSFTNYACEALPDECGSQPSCDCIGSMCGGSASKGLHRTVHMM